jgi:hypothetical protein
MMATPVIELHQRLRAAGLNNEAADAIGGAFELLHGDVRSLKRGQWVTWALVTLVLAAVVAPYFDRLLLLPGAGQ